jgi:hypothetical protein
MSARFFPTLLIGLMFAAALVYGLHGDWRKCVYFVAAGVLNLVVVF